MGINSHISDKATKLTAEVIHKDDYDCNALKVATVPLRDFDNQIKFFFNDTYGVDMNQDAAFGAGAEIVYTADSVLWVFNDIVGGGKTTPINDEHPHTGTYALKVDNSPVGDVYDFDNEADFDLTGHTAITMWIYADKDWKAGDSVEFYAWDKAGVNAQVGTAVDLSDYFDYTTTKVYHKLIIPITDMGLTGLTIDSLRVKQAAAEGKAPKYFLDDVQIETTGLPIKFSLMADKGTWLYVDEFTISMADNITGIEAGLSLPLLPYDKFLGVTLSSGLVYKRELAKKQIFSQTINNFLEWMQLPGTEITGQGSDGTNTWVTIRAKHAEPLLLKTEQEDEFSFTINDDLSGLLHFRISAGCRVETRDI